MGEAKPTPGPWWIDEHGGLRHGVAHARDTVPVSGVALLSGNVSERVKQAEANRDLLFEAGTVFHTTNLTPSQLVERVKELEAALRYARRFLRKADHDTDYVDAALSKARPNTAEGEAARLLRQILAASQDGDSDTHLSAHFVSRIETITQPGGAA